jgi:hypothetical protein
MWLDRLFRRRTIADPNGNPYLDRWFILRTDRLPFQIYLHHILRSDHDRDLHDHPWWFLTFILWGGYYEWQPSAISKFCQPIKYLRRPGSILYRRANHLHRLELTKPAWTLVIRGRKSREWGFVSGCGKWIPWREYLGLQDAADPDTAAMDSES